MANVTIPSLPVWGLGPNPLTGQELFVISPTASTATPSSQLSLLNLAKYPMILPTPTQASINLNPASFILPAYSVGSAIAVGVTLNQLQVSQGNVPAGGLTGQALVKLSNANFDDNWGSVGVPGGGTGTGTFPQYALLYGNNTATIGSTNTATASVLITDNTTGIPSLSSTLPGAVQLNITEVGTIGTGVWNGTIVTPSFGGTGRANLTAHGVLIGEGTGSVNVTPAPSAAQLLVGQSTTTDPAFTTIVGDWSLTAAGTATIATAAVTFAKFQTFTGLSVHGVTGTATGISGAITGAANQVLQVNSGGTALLFAPLSLTATVSGVLTVPNGGTGDSTMTSFGVLIGNGTSAILATQAGSGGQLLVGQTTTSSPAFTTIVGDVTFSAAGTATIANNAVTFAKFQTMTGLSVMGVAGTATTNASTIVGTAATVLQVNGAGTGVLFSQINLAATTSTVTGTLPIANGGTNASVYTTALLNLNGVSLTGTNQTLSAGFNVITDNLGTATGTVTLAYGNGSLQRLISNNTFTLNATTATDGEADLLVTNATGASTITITNFNVGSNTGDPYVTTVGNKYIFMARTINGSATYKWAALQ